MNDFRTFVQSAGLAMTTLSLVGLAACGGGGGGTDAASEAAAAASDSTASAAADDHVEALATTTKTWTFLASESATFNVPTKSKLRYGSGSSWIIKTWGGSGTCSNDFFGSDPVPGVKKECDIYTTTTTTTPSSSVTASIVPTRTTGVAPLGVLFDATGTTAGSGVDTFRQVSYSFDFGDDQGLTWPVSGVSKNVQTGGPIAAHVFEKAGTYNITVTAKDASGNTSSKTVSITVQDANAAYTGTKTVCVSAKSDYTDCPSGAAYQTALPSGTAWNGKRVLLHRGESFGDISIQDGNATVQVGAYGSGNLPSVNSVGVGTSRPATASFANDITVMDLAVVNGISQSIGKRVLLLRNDMTSQSDGHGIYIGGVKYWAHDDPYRIVPTSDFYYASEIFVVENKVTGSFNDGGYNMFGDGSQVAILGNVMGTSKYHTLRMTKMRKGIVAHNELKGINPSGTYHSLKIHSGGMTSYTDAYVDDAWYSEQDVVVNNLFGNAADNNQWTVAICPENDQVAEGVTNVVVDTNTFIRNSHTVQDLTLAGKSLTYRSNVVSGGGSLWEGVGHEQALPSDWKGPYYSN